MSDALDTFVERLNYGQPYLFLGQSYLSEYKKSYYSLAASKLSADPNSNAYLSIEKNEESTEDLLRWLQSEADYIDLPNWGKYLALISWNGVITSSVEYFVEKILKLEMREVQPVYQFGKNLPYNFKSKHVLHISYLFGCLNQVQEGFRPPISSFELSAYKSNASMLLNRIDAEFLSPVGMLVIDGYDPACDWINSEMLYSVCSKLGKKQVFFFGFKEELLNDPFIKRLVECDVIIPVHSTLIEVIEQARETGLLIGSLHLSLPLLTTSSKDHRAGRPLLTLSGSRRSLHERSDLPYGQNKPRLQPDP